MAKYTRFDPRNKKKRNDKYRSEKKKPTKNYESTARHEHALIKEIEKRYNV